MLVSDRPLPSVVSRVEYYREQRLFMLVYNTITAQDDDNEDSDLLEYEIPENMAKPVEHSPNVIIYSLFPDHDPIGYKVPLIKVGDIYQ